MNKIKVTFLLVTSIFLLSTAGFAASPADGDSLFVWTKGATTAVVYSLDDLDKLTFDDNAMSVWTNKGTNKTDYAYGNIGLLTFREGIRPVAGVEMLTAAEAKVRISYDRDAEMVIVISEKPLTGLLVCDLQGRTVARQSKTANRLQLSLASLPLGVYIVKTQGFSAGKSAKIIK